MLRMFRTLVFCLLILQSNTLRVRAGVVLFARFCFIVSGAHSMRSMGSAPLHVSEGVLSPRFDALGAFELSQEASPNNWFEGCSPLS